MIETNCKLNIFSTCEEIGSLTNSEIEGLTANVPEVEREHLNIAARALHGAKLRSGNRTPWQELLVKFRSTLPYQVEQSVVFQDGEIGIQTVFTERGFGLTGDEQFMFSALNELHAVLGRIENIDPKKYFFDGVYRLTQAKTAGEPRPEARTRAVKLAELGAWLANRGYKESDDKNGLIDGAMEKYKCGVTDVRDAARIAGLTRSYKQSTK